MKCVIKVLIDVEAMDDPAARKSFRDMSENIIDAVGDTELIRDLKIVEDGNGRLIDKWEADS